MKFVVVEIQNGVIGGNSWVFDDINQAKSKYHSVLAIAAVSQVTAHSAAILNETGRCLVNEGYNHDHPEEVNVE